MQRDAKELSKQEFKPFETVTGHIVKDLESAIAFTIGHDGIHSGTIDSMLVVLQQNA